MKYLNQIKICYSCKKSKNQSEFSKHNQKKDGLDPNCKACRNAKAKKYYRNPKPKKIISTKVNYKICSKCNLEKYVDAFSNYKRAKDGKKSACKECLKSQGKKYYNKNKEKESIRKQKYYRNNKEYIIKRSGGYNTNRRNIDPLFKAKHNLRKRLRSVLLKTRWNKSNTFAQYIGCTLDELKAHLEFQFKSDMTWENYGEWEIDHIIPLASAKTEQELFKLCHYSNLQPLWMSENRSKSNKI